MQLSTMKVFLLSLIVFISFVFPNVSSFHAVVSNYQIIPTGSRTNFAPSSSSSSSSSSSYMKQFPTTLLPKTQSSTSLFRARFCDLLGTRPNRQARTISFSHRRTKTVQMVNLQVKHYVSSLLKRIVKLRISARGIKTVENVYEGDIDKAAKKFGVDLNQF